MKCLHVGEALSAYPILSGITSIVYYNLGGDLQGNVEGLPARGHTNQSEANMRGSSPF